MEVREHVHVWEKDFHNKKHTKSIVQLWNYEISHTQARTHYHFFFLCQLIVVLKVIAIAARAVISWFIHHKNLPQKLGNTFIILYINKENVRNVFFRITY